MKSMLNVARSMVVSFLYETRRELNKVAVLLRIAAPVIIACCFKNIMLMLAVSVICNIAISFIMGVYRDINKVAETGMPLPEKRYTRDENGIVTLVPNRESEAILYINTVEEYLKKKGLVDYGQDTVS